MTTRKPTLSVLLAVTLGGSLVSTVRCQDPPSPNFRETLKGIEKAHLALLESGSCQGHLLHEVREAGDKDWSTLVDCDFRVIFQGDNFRLERVFRKNKMSKEFQSQYWESGPFDRDVLLCNGRRNYWVRYHGVEESCFVLNRQWATSVLGYWDSPAPHPFRMWEVAHHFLEDESLKYQVKRLGGSGVLAVGHDEGIQRKAYFVPPEPLRLTRIVIDWRGETVGEINVQWMTSNGVPCVRRYSQQLQGKQLPMWSRRVVEFWELEANTKMEPQHFELGSLGLEEGTEFEMSAPVPTRFVFDGKELVKVAR